MEKAIKKTDKPATFDQLIADSEPEQKTIQVGGHSVVIQELSGAHRFELAERTDDSRWELLLWVCMNGMVDPKPNKPSYLEKLRPEWVIEIATAITDISGISTEAMDEAENESANVTDIGGS